MSNRSTQLIYIETVLRQLYSTGGRGGAGPYAHFLHCLAHSVGKRRQLVGDELAVEGKSHSTAIANPNYFLLSSDRQF